MILMIYIFFARTYAQLSRLLFFTLYISCFLPRWNLQVDVICSNKDSYSDDMRKFWRHDDDMMSWRRFDVMMTLWHHWFCEVVTSYRRVDVIMTVRCHEDLVASLCSCTRGRLKEMFHLLVDWGSRAGTVNTEGKFLLRSHKHWSILWAIIQIFWYKENEMRV